MSGNSNILGHVENEVQVSQSLDEYMFGAFVEHMLNGVAYCKMLYCDGEPNDFVYLYTNPAFEALTGLKQVVGRRGSDVIPGIRDKDPQLFEIYNRVAMGGQPERVETLVESVDSWFSISVYSPKREHFVAIFDDITERKQTELALKVANERWSLVHSAAFIGTWDWNLTNNQTTFNAEYYKLLGLPDGTAHSYDEFLFMLHPDDRLRFDETVKRAMHESVKDYQIEYRLTRANDGRMRWLVSKGRFIIENGQPLRSLGVVYDITERRQAEEMLRQSEILYRQMFMANPQPMWIYDLETLSFLAVNHAAIAHYGYSEAEFLAMTIADIRPREDMQKLLDNIHHVQADTLDEAGIWRHIKKDGTLIDVEITSHELEYEGRRAEVVLSHDVTERKRAEAKIQFLANYDPLTGLPNRNLLNDHLRYAISLAKRSNGQLALMFLDLDHFKDVNDTLGHSVGDALLIELANRLRVVLREEDTVTRLGGDEFILLLSNVNADGAATVAQKLLDSIAKPYHIEIYDLTLTASIGIAIYPGDGVDLETLSKSADSAMYQAKQEGRRGYRFFTPEMQAHSVRNMQLINALRHALETRSFQIYYQPQVSLSDGQIIGAEALIRWQHSELGWISPAEFIPLAEDSGLILAIGEWILRCAVRQTAIWRKMGNPEFIMAVNLSAVQFRHPDLPNLVSQILAEEGLPAECLELELTESVAMHAPQGAIAVMNNLHGRGIRMSIDDFGTGYSSLNYLKKFKVYKLKIDQSFVRDISTDPEDKAIVSAVISLAKSLGLKTIAEGVETDEQRIYLQQQGCDEMQGYLFCKPVPSEQFERLYQKYFDHR